MTALIVSFQDKKLEKCWMTGKCPSISGSAKKRVLNKLDMMNASTCMEDLNNPPSNHLHQLHGDYEGFWAIRVSGAWRLIFKVLEGKSFELHEVAFVQYH